MSQAKLVLSLPQGIITATSLAVNEFALHRSPGSGKYFDGRSLLVDLAVEGGKPAFQFNDEGGWRDANADASAALEAAQAGKRWPDAAHRAIAGGRRSRLGGVGRAAARFR